MALNNSDAIRVRSIQLFDKVSDACLPTLLKTAAMRFFPARAVLFNEGDRASALYTLIHGSVELFIDWRSAVYDRHHSVS